MRIFLYTNLYKEGFKFTTYNAITKIKYLVDRSFFFDKNLYTKFLYKVSVYLILALSNKNTFRINHERVWAVLIIPFIRRGGVALFSLRMNEAMRLHKLLGGLVFLDFSENIPDEYLNYYSNECSRLGIVNNKISALIEMGERTHESLKISDLIMVYSKEHSNLLRKYYPNKKIIINHLPPEFTQKYKPTASKKIINVYSIGQISILKGSHKLLEIWSNKTMRGYNLFLIGDIQDCIIEYIQQFGISDNISIIKPYQINKVFSDVKSNNGILCQPSLTEAGVSRVLVNAVYSGIPIISTFVPSYLKINSSVFELPINIDSLLLMDTIINFLKLNAYQNSYASSHYDLPKVSSKSFIENIQSSSEA